MTQRIAKLYGKLDSNTPTFATVWFDNQIVHSGQLSFTEPPDGEGFGTVATWFIDLQQHGDIPLSIEITQGKFVFVSVLMNYMGNRILWKIKPDAVWSAYVPKDADDLHHDYVCMTSEEFFNKYQMRRVDVDALNKEVIGHIPSKDNFDHPNLVTVDSHDKNNVKINGVLRPRKILLQHQVGRWHYTIDQNERLDCDYTVLPPDLNPGITNLRYS